MKEFEQSSTTRNSQKRCSTTYEELQYVSLLNAIYFQLLWYRTKRLVKVASKKKKQEMFISCF